METGKFHENSIQWLPIFVTTDQIMYILYRNYDA